ncbi:hypothetical protein BH11MYX1_BH11MYX1_09490 [soil metagenome]
MSETKTNPMLAIALAVVAALGLLFASFSARWLANYGTEGSIEMGLRSTTECGSVGMLLGPAPGECRTQSSGDYAKAWNVNEGRYYSAAWAPLGLVTLIASLLGAFGLLAGAGIGCLKMKPHLPMSPSSVALIGIMISMISGCVFVAPKPGVPGMAGVGIAFWIYGAGAVVGIASAIMLAKVNRPADPDLMDDAMNPDNF